MNTHRFHSIASTALILAWGATSASAALAGMTPPAEIYNKAEQWFQVLETEQNYVPLERSTLLTEGYYHRCYENGECYGVSLGTADGLIYKKATGTDWERMGALDELLAAPAALPVQRLGKLRGALAPHVSRQVLPLGVIRPVTPPPMQAAAQPSGSSSSLPLAPLVIGEGSWTKASRSNIQAAFMAGTPVALLNATPAEVAALRKLVNITGTSPASSSAPTLDAYAIDKDSQGNVYELAIHAPDARNKMVSVFSKGTPETGPVKTTTETIASFTDTPALQSVRTRELMDWLKQDRVRDVGAAQRKAEGQVALAGSAEDNDHFKSLEDAVTAYEDRQVIPFKTNIHILKTLAWSVHNIDRDEDWFYFRQEANFSAANEVQPLALINDASATEGRRRWWITDYYRVGAYVASYTPGTYETTPEVVLDQNSPPTTEGATKILSTVSWNMGGKISGNSKGEGSVEINGGVSVSNSYSYDIRDVSVRNLSGSRLNNALWDFNIARPQYTDSGFGCIGFSGLSPMAPVSGATFQPVTQWFWRVGKEVREKSPGALPVYVVFQSELIDMGYTKGLCSLDSWGHAVKSQYFQHYVAVPWPAKN